MSKQTSAIKTLLYPKIEERLNTPKGKSAYKECVSEFISSRGKEIYDTIPCSRIFFGENDVSSLFNALQIDQSVATEAIDKTYYHEITNFNPRAAKDEFTVTQLMVVRYFFLKHMTKEMEIAMIHLAFSGKFYPSIHFRSYPVVAPARHVMEYVINNELTQKFDLISTGSIFGVMKSITATWINTYGNRMKDCDDGDVVYLIQQLHSRIGSFMKNLAEEYYKAYEDKDNFMTYDSDNLDADNYHLADSDVLRTQRYVEKTVNVINTVGVDYKICKMCSDSNIKATEVQSIIESLVSTPENMITIKEFIGLLIACYYNLGGGKDIRDISFITYSIQAKPNAKQKEIVRQKEIVENWLCENSTTYLRRRSRLATKNSYEKAIIKYFTIATHNANR